MLILYGFGVVSLPLIGALIYGAIHMERLADQSQDAVHQAVRAIEHSNRVMEHITSMERTGRQYLVLQDADLLAAYRKSHQNFQATATNLKGMPLDNAQYQLVNQLLRAENALYKHIQEAEPTPTNQQEVASAFAGLIAKGEQLMHRSNGLINREVDVLRRDAAHDQRVLFWLAASLIPLSLASAAVFTVLISRPIRQVDHAIREMGEGDFQRAVRVSGPQDLKYVGELLDWLRQRLAELEQEKTRFLRHVSHELKTPLTAIREGSELLDERSVGELNQEQSEIIRIIRRSSGQLQRLIENLLNFSNVQVGSPDLQLERVDLRALVREVVESHKPAILAKGLQLETDLDELQINADEEKLKTVVDNLLSNSIKFSPHGGRLLVMAKRDDGEAILDVVDSGPGIRGEDSQRVFDAFYQGTNKGEGFVKGSGLGLSITREYVTAHQGSIRVISNDDQPGGHLRVALPIGAGQEAA
jgi:two-component system sensor histidine kinase GlrK